MIWLYVASPSIQIFKKVQKNFTANGAGTKADISELGRKSRLLIAIHTKKFLPQGGYDVIASLLANKEKVKKMLR